MIGGPAHLLYLYLYLYKILHPFNTIAQGIEMSVIVIRVRLLLASLSMRCPCSLAKRLEFRKPTLGGLFRRKQFGLR